MHQKEYCSPASFIFIILISIVFTKNEKAHSFVIPQPYSSILMKPKSSSSIALSSSPSQEETVKAMQDYMARSHEDKLRALKDLADKKDAEIRELKNRLNGVPEQSQSSAIQLSGATSSSVDVNELKNKIENYQKFISKYIIQAQEDKTRAVKEAENKFKQKLLLLSPSSPSSTPLPESPKLFQERNAKIAAAASKGKSPRWGNAEVQKVQSSDPTSTAKNVPTTASKVESVLEKVSPPPPVTENSPEIIAADHGIKREGDLSLAERVVNGSQATSPPPPVIEADPQIIAADHGIRREGDLSLAERVVLGSQASITKKEDSPAPETTVSNITSNYTKRNQKVARAAKANKSNRWGDQEVAKVTSILEQLPPATEDPVATKEDEPVNIGAQILSV